MKPAMATLACSLLVLFCAHAARATEGPRIARKQEIVALLDTHSVRDKPTVYGKRVALVAATRPITGERTMLPVLAHATDNRRRAWLRVRLPGRTLDRQPPRAGWISASNTQISTTRWHIVVDLIARRVDVYLNGRRLRSYPAIVGKPSTPTPTGEYFVEENVQLPANQPGAPFALATSDRSNVLQQFDGGPGQIALHGLENLGGQLGTAVSHGCIRLADSAITWLAARINPGVPLTIN